MATEHDAQSIQALQAKETTPPQYAHNDLPRVPLVPPVNIGMSRQEAVPDIVNQHLILQPHAPRANIGMEPHA